MDSFGYFGRSKLKLNKARFGLRSIDCVCRVVVYDARLSRLH